MMMNDFENELDRIRVTLYEKTKDMSAAQAAAAMNNSGRRIAEKYGMTITKREPAISAQNAKMM